MSPESLRKLTEALVAIQSHDDEGRAGAFIRDWLRDNTAASVTRDETGNIIARKGPRGRSLAFIGHHDVVEPSTSQMDGDRVLIEEREGRLYGRGTADMKGAVAAMLRAFRDASPDSELVFASFVGEEQGGVGARAAIEDGFAPDYAIVGEGSASYSSQGVLDVAIAHKGRRGSTIQATGTSAHASEPDEGENAIYRATEAIEKVRNIEPPKTAVFGRELTGSVAVTEIEGGTAWNVIPAGCEVTVDERTVPGDRADLAAVESIEGVDWTIDQDLPPMRCDEQAFADRVQGAARETQWGSPAQAVKPHATDAGWLADAGTTCVVCGPAEPGEAHTDSESVSLRLLEAAEECYLDIADGWAGEFG